MRKPISFYIHIPFCVKKCLYCDFPSYSGCEELFEDYTDSLLEELRQCSDYMDGYEIQTIFFGGGTPTVLPIQFTAKIMDMIIHNYHISEKAEISLEANPGTIHASNLKELKKMNFNRISIGVQAFQNSLLKGLGRIHNIETFLTNYEEVKNVGFQNINLDLMFALPNQTLSDWEKTLEGAMNLNPSHISCYSLIVEEGTPFHTLYEENRLLLPSEELDRQMYTMAKMMLGANDFYQYEISNFAKKGAECQHNCVYWRDEEYMGFGLSSHSYFQGKRFHNTCDMKKYLNANGNFKLCHEEVEKIGLKQEYSEFMFMGLRLINGVEKERFRIRFGKGIMDVYSKQIIKLKAEGLLMEKAEGYALTERGIDISNYVFEQFLL